MSIFEWLFYTGFTVPTFFEFTFIKVMNFFPFDTGSDEVGEMFWKRAFFIFYILSSLAQAIFKLLFICYDPGTFFWGGGGGGKEMKK